MGTGGCIILLTAATRPTAIAMWRTVTGAEAELAEQIVSVRVSFPVIRRWAVAEDRVELTACGPKARDEGERIGLEIPRWAQAIDRTSVVPDKEAPIGWPRPTDRHMAEMRGAAHLREVALIE